MIPLLMASGPGAASRSRWRGDCVRHGIAHLTLFVLPAFYLYLARDHGHLREATTGARIDASAITTSSA